MNTWSVLSLAGLSRNSQKSGQLASRLPPPPPPPPPLRHLSPSAVVGPIRHRMLAKVSHWYVCVQITKSSSKVRTHFG